MKAAVLAVVVLFLGSGCAPQARWYEAQPTPSPKELNWEIDVMVRDPLTTTAADVVDLHRESKRVVCRLGRIRPSDPDAARPTADALLDRLKLCRDKGFDAVAFTAPTDALKREAAALRLPVLELPLALRTEE
ncbi:MAG TPA: hypothetical protein VF062_06600 [Candidatus Limnocylindrales bacterium]